MYVCIKKIEGGSRVIEMLHKGENGWHIPKIKWVEINNHLQVVPLFQILPLLQL